TGVDADEARSRGTHQGFRQAIAPLPGRLDLRGGPLSCSPRTHDTPQLTLKWDTLQFKSMGGFVSRCPPLPKSTGHARQEGHSMQPELGDILVVDDSEL